MQNLQKISRCLISVSDKTGIVELAKYLSEKGVEIISTGGTYKLLQDNKIAALEISEFTNFPEMMDGRLKTLHPKVHGGLLAVLSDETHQKQAAENGIKSIDLLVVNLYPFVETVARTSNAEEIIENIDIGGPAMVRSAGKNFAFKAVITEAASYQLLREEMEKNSGATSFEFRKNAAAQAFKNIAEYDEAISQYFNNGREAVLVRVGENNKNLAKNSVVNKDNSLALANENKEFVANDDLSEAAAEFTLQGKLKQPLRYGENSHQKAAVYSNSNSGIVNAKQLQGKELSYNNFNDADAAYNLILEFSQPACAIIKHANPCGVAVGDNLGEAYAKALQADSKSAFGGIVALNSEIDEALAQELSKMFFEVIIAQKISDKAAEILAAKKNLRVLIADFKKMAQTQVKSISGGFLTQDLDQKNIAKSDLQQVSKVAVSNEELDQLVFAMQVCKHVKSNAIVVVNGLQTVGMGAGQTSRVDACEIACKKAAEFFDGATNVDKAHGAYLASDAFFPFADNIEIAAARGIKAIVAPRGSIRDEEVIEMANAKGIALYFIDGRHFRH